MFNVQARNIDQMAFWSGTDNNDDGKRNRYSVVVGKMKNLLSPEIKCRLSFEKRNIDIQIEDMFDDLDNYEFDLDFSVEMKKLNKSKPVVPFAVNGFNSNYKVYWGDHKNAFGKGGADKPRTFFNKSDSMQSSVIKCTRCGKFNNIAKMHVDATDIFCDTCFDAMANFTFNRSEQLQLGYSEGGGCVTQWDEYYGI